MSFVGHLEELRKRLLICLVALCAASVACYWYCDAFISFLTRPVGSLVFLAPAEAFLSRLKIAFFAGFLISAPVILYQAWHFVVLALTDKERKALFWILPCSYLLFIAGCALCLFAVQPAAIQFLLAYGSDDLRPLLTVSAYLKFTVSLALAFGLLFQLPLVLFFLHWMNIVSLERLNAWRRTVYLASFIVAALLTPGPDIFSQILLALPTLALYEVSLFAMRLYSPSKSS